MKVNNNNSGYIMVIALLVFFGIFTIGMSLVSRSSMLLTMEENARKKIQSFYASDGQLTLLSQELIDGNSRKYRSKNFLVYDDFMRPGNENLDSGWIEVETDIQNKLDIVAERLLFTSNGDSSYRPLLKKFFTAQTGDTLTWQFTMQWQCNDPAYDTFALYFQLGNNMPDNEPWDNVAVNLRWGDRNATGFTSEEMIGYVSNVQCDFHGSNCTPEGKGLKVIKTAAQIKVIIYMESKRYSIQIDGKEYAKNIPFFKSDVMSINQMRIFTHNLNTVKFSGSTIDNISLLKKAAESYSSTDELNYGNFGVAWDVIEEEIGKFKLVTNSYFKDAPTLNKYRTPLYQSITNPGLIDVEYPTDITIPVRFYDFHSDRRNPEFEQPITGGSIAKRGMVALKLDNNGKPQLSGNTSRYVLNYYIKYWFRPSPFLPNDNLRMYTTTRDFMDFSGSDDLTTTNNIRIPRGSKFRLANNAFENRVYDTTLVFSHIGDGVYQFRDDSFFPLDCKCFGIESNNANPPKDKHNFSFTMEMTHSFVKVPGQYFTFTGDDDIWVFVNDSLVLDMGGKHSAVSDSFFVDLLPNFEDNTAYTMKIFYCERHSSQSNILITTNIVFSTSAQSSRSRMWGRDYGNIY